MVSFTLSGTAQNGFDYQTINHSAIIPAAQSSVLIPVIAQGSRDIASTKTLVLTLAAGEAYSIGSDASATILIENPGPNPRIRADDIKVSADGTVSLTIDSVAGASYTVERSTNLLEWTVVQTIEESSSVMHVQDHADRFQQSRFYRARLLVPNR